MFKYAHLKFSKSNKSEKVKLQVGTSIIEASGRAGKWYTNIPTEKIKREEISLLDNGDQRCELVFTDEKLFHPDQVIFDKKYNIKKHSLQDENIYYSLSGEKVRPKKILITFPGVSNFDNINYRLSAMTSLQSRLKDILILAFQDREGVFGNYMFETESGYPIKSIGISLINGLADRYGLTDSDLIFYGNSKGASIALKYIEKYKNSHFFIDIPQLDLANYEQQNDLMKFSIGPNPPLHYDFTTTLPLVKNRLLTYSFAEDDFDSSRGLPMKSFPNINVVMLKDMQHSGAAMELVKRQFSKVLQLIGDEQKTLRPRISAKWKIDNNRLFFERSLGSFEDENDIPKIFSEIEFHNNENNFSISLNKRFSKKVIVSWDDGFDVMKHLPVGKYEMKLHVYYNFKEFCYPLDKSITISFENISIEDNLH
ncbi:hypothetical protein [Ewingella americana]|uniref:hypothetical protein n=1 Tax=Ewingella americana TaxID=41202 RepID=UPI00163A8A01|nr:hypothetical protein [Ewingella americana]QMV52381.1 hypothetical protein GXP68_14255 [Ewingella americana]